MIFRVVFSPRLAVRALREALCGSASARKQKAQEETPERRLARAVPAAPPPAPEPSGLIAGSTATAVAGLPEAPDGVLQDRVQTQIAVVMCGGDALRRDVLFTATQPAADNVEKKRSVPYRRRAILAGAVVAKVKTRRESVEALPNGRS